MSETTEPVFEIRATQLPSPPHTYQFSLFLDNVQVIEGYAFDWSFGDGGSSDLPSPIHIYPGPGNYQVTLDVKEIPDRDGKGGSQTEDNPPPNPPPPLMVTVS